MINSLYSQSNQNTVHTLNADGIQENEYSQMLTIINSDQVIDEFDIKKLKDLGVSDQDISLILEASKTLASTDDAEIDDLISSIFK